MTAQERNNRKSENNMLLHQMAGPLKTDEVGNEIWQCYSIILPRSIFNI
jgi:hypothetical protein